MTLRINILDMMSILLLPYMEDGTTEFETFNYAVNSYANGNNVQLLGHLTHLAISDNIGIASGAMELLEKATSGNF